MKMAALSANERRRDDLYSEPGTAPYRAPAPQKTIQPVSRATAPSLATGMAALAGQKTIQPVAAAPAAALAPATMPTSLADQLRAQNPAMNWNIQGIDRAQELGDWLSSRGVKDISAPKLTWEDYTKPGEFIGMGTTESGEVYPQLRDPTTEKRGYLDFGGVRLGNEGNIHTKNGLLGYIPDRGSKNNNQAFASSTKGHGAVSYQYVQGADGKLQIIPKWTSTSDMGVVRDILKGGLALAGGFGLAGMGPLSGLGQALGTAGSAGSTAAATGAATGAADIGALGLAEGVYGAGGALGAGAAPGTVGGLAGSTTGLGGLGSVLPASVGFSAPGALAAGEFGLSTVGGPDPAGIVPGGTEVPEVFNAAKDSAAASAELGYTGAELAAGGAPASVNLGSAGTYATGGGIVNNIANALEAAKVNPAGALASAGSSVLDFAKANPGLAAMGLGALGSLTSSQPEMPSAGGGSGSGGTLTPGAQQISDSLGSLDFSGLPGLQTSAGDRNTFNQSAIDAAYGQQTRYLDPQIQQQQRALEARLSEQGFVPGTPAYNQAMQNFMDTNQRAYASARDSSILQGTQIGQADYRNAISGVTLNNSAAAQALEQYLAKRSAPINERNALLSGDQVVYGQQLDRYNAQAAESNNRNQALSQLALALGIYLG